MGPIREVHPSVILPPRPLETSAPEADAPAPTAAEADDGYTMGNAATMAGVFGFLGGNIGMLSGGGLSRAGIGFGVGAAIGGAIGTSIYLGARESGTAGDTKPAEFLTLGSMATGAVLGGVAGPTLLASKLSGGPGQKAIAGGAMGMLALGAVGMLVQNRIED